MAKRFLNNINLEQNQIINVLLEKRTGADGTGIEGQIMYREDTDVIKYHDGTSWITLASSSSAVNSVTAGDGLSDSGTATDPILDINVDDATVEINADTVRVKALGIDTPQLADDAVTTIKITDSNVTFAKIQDIPTMTVIGRVAGGSGVSSAISILDEDDMTSNSATALATQQSIKAYVDATVASIGTLQGGYDANTNTNFPSPSEAGDYWYVTVAGTIQGVSFDVGDVILANQDSASTTDPNEWTFLETNREQATTTIVGVTRFATTAEAQGLTDNTVALTPAGLATVTATETRTGIAEIATQSETDTGTDDARIVTPLKLKTFFDNAVGGYAADIGNGAATSFAITHNLGTIDVVTNVIDNSTDEQVIVDITHDTVNQVTVTFASAPSTDAYRIIIKK